MSLPWAWCSICGCLFPGAQVLGWLVGGVKVAGQGLREACKEGMAGPRKRGRAEKAQKCVVGDGLASACLGSDRGGGCGRGTPTSCTCSVLSVLRGDLGMAEASASGSYCAVIRRQVTR